MKKRSLLLVMIGFNTICYAKSVSVTIINNTEATIEKIKITDKKDSIEEISSSLGFGEGKSFDLDSENSYKIELFDGQGHKYSKKNAFSSGTSKKEAKANKKESKKPETEQKLQGGEYQVFTESWQKIIFTDSDFESQGKTDAVKKFFGINGKSKNKKDITQTCAVIVTNSTGKNIDSYCIKQGDVSKGEGSLKFKKGETKTIDIQRNLETSIIFKSGDYEYLSENLKFTTENTRLEITDENRITKNLIEKADDKVHYIWNGTKNTASKVVNFVSNKINKKGDSDE